MSNWRRRHWYEKKIHRPLRMRRCTYAEIFSIRKLCCELWTLSNRPSLGKLFDRGWWEIGIESFSSNFVSDKVSKLWVNMRNAWVYSQCRYMRAVSTKISRFVFDFHSCLHVSQAYCASRLWKKRGRMEDEFVYKNEKEIGKSFPLVLLDLILILKIVVIINCSASIFLCWLIQFLCSIIFPLMYTRMKI